MKPHLLPYGIALMLSALLGAETTLDTHFTTEALSRKEALPEERFINQEDSYLQGYVQALVDMHYYENAVSVQFQKGHVTLGHLPASLEMRQRIISFVQDIPEVKSVSLIDSEEIKRPLNRTKGIFFPEASSLFKPLIADPRQTTYSAAYRFNDGIFSKRCAAVTLGDQFPLYRWHNVGKWQGDLQLDLEGGIFSVFDVDSYSAPLVNTDFLVSLMGTYAIDQWSFRARLTHISSHLGDEWLTYVNPGMNRLNPSRETIDFFASYQLTEAMRFYGGVGVVCSSDKSYEVEPLYFEYGLEALLPQKNSPYYRIYGRPFFAMHFRNWQDFEWVGDRTYALGYEWGKMQGTGRKVRLYLEYHDGFCMEGQYSRHRSNYLSSRISWSF
ncbi:MAG: hypothetical protein K0S07_1664 [Chlamydiales bacterium]|jgi:hypothetical protein|nr:hypothetical protein [Chlamydiales bacterium]